MLEEGMTLYPKNNVYFPGKEYYSSDPLPSDWIGLITNKTVLDSSGFSDKIPLEQSLNSSLDLKELVSDL